MTDMGRLHRVPDIWLSGLVAALGALAQAPAPSAEVTESCRRHLGMPPTLPDAPGTAPDAALDTAFAAPDPLPAPPPSSSSQRCEPETIH